MKNTGKAVVLSTGLVLGGFSVPMKPLNPVYAEESSTVKFSSTTFQTIENVDLYTGVDEPYEVILTIPIGSTVVSSERIGDWYNVSYTYIQDGKSITERGWLDGGNLKEFYQYTNISGGYYSTNKPINLYSTPDTKNEVKKSIEAGDVLYTTQQVTNSLGETWYRVFLNDETLYIRSSDLTLTEPKSIKNGNFEVISDASLFDYHGRIFNKLVDIPKGTKIISNLSIGDWYRINYSYQSSGSTVTKTGWINKSNLQQSYQYANIAGSYYFVNKETSFYPTPDTKNQADSSISIGDVVYTTQQVLNSAGEIWYRTFINGKTLYIKGSDVTGAKPKSFPKAGYELIRDANLYEYHGGIFNKLTIIPKGTKISSNFRIGNWYKVSYSYNTNGSTVTKTGWINNRNVKESYKYINISGSYYIVNTNTNLYPIPDINSKSEQSVGAGDVIYTTQQVTNNDGQLWYRAFVNGKTLYFKASNVTKTEPTRFSIENFNVITDANLFEYHGGIFNKLAVIPKGTKISSSSRIGDWYKVSYSYLSNGNKVAKSGWINSSNLEKSYKYTNISGSYYMVNKSTSFYPTPDTKNQADTNVETGDVIYTTQQVTNNDGQIWYRAFVNGETLYINSSDVTMTERKNFSKENFDVISDANLYEYHGEVFNRLAQIPIGTKLSSDFQIGNWYHVSYSYMSNGTKIAKTGWVNKSNIEKSYKYTKISGSYYTVNKTTSFYPTPDTKNQAVSNVEPGDVIYTTQQVTNGKGEIWYRLYVNGETLYIISNEVTRMEPKSFPVDRYEVINETFLYEYHGFIFNKLAPIPQGAEVSSNLRIGGWNKVSYSYVSNGEKITETGWVNSSHIQKLYKYISISGSYYTTKKATSLYSTPEREQVASSIELGDVLYTTQQVINGKGELWYRVFVNGKTLYISDNDVTKETSDSFPTIKFKTNKDTSLFSYHGKLFNKLVNIPKGIVVSSSFSVGNWYKVSYGGKTGYLNISDLDVDQQYTEKTISGKTYLILTNLNIRKSASEFADKLGSVPEGEIVKPTHETSNGWYKVSFGGKTGYISGSYVQEVRTGDPITTRDSYQFIDLRTQSNVTATQINNYISNYVNLNNKTSVLTGKGQAFIDAGKKYGVNALYLVAHAIHESAYGTSSISLGKLNLFGFGSYDAAPFVSSYIFSSVEENIDYIAREMKATYLNPDNWKYKGAYLGFSTKTMSNTRIDANSEGMNFYYASDPYWGKAIASHMEKILPYDKNYYSNATPNNTFPSRPAIPSGSDFFPTGIVAVANQDLALKEKDTGKFIKTLTRGTDFVLLEKTNDFWVKIKLDGKIYWTDSIRFDRYKEYVSVKNLARVTTDNLNVRPTASTSISPIGSLKLNQYVQLVMGKDGNPIMDSTKVWFKVKLANGSEGWIHSVYFTQELK